MFPAALERAFNGAGYQFQTGSASMNIMLLKDSWTAAEAWATTDWSVSLSPAACLLSANGNARNLAGTIFTTTTSNKWKFDATDLTICASVGVNISAKYAVIFQSGVTAPLFVCQLSTTAIVANKIAVVFNAAGIFELSQSVSVLPGTP